MNTILKKTQLSDDVFQMRVAAPLIAEERKPGQFVIVQIDSNFGERIPLTIADADPVEGSITLIFQAVGKTTLRLAALKEGDAIENLLGPLGRPTHIEKVGTVVCVGGGIGVAPLFPIAQGFKQAGNKVIIILGARNQKLLILEQAMRDIADELAPKLKAKGFKGRLITPLPVLPPPAAATKGLPVCARTTARTTTAPMCATPTAPRSNCTSRPENRLQATLRNGSGACPAITTRLRPACLAA